jgi:uncharacterized membrane protein (DUF485 family)
VTAADQPPTTTGGPGVPADPHDFAAVQASAEFQALRKALRGFVFPATAAFLTWYLLYVVMSAYARGFMDTRVAGVINVAFVFGLLQFVSTFALAFAYSRYADKHIDPLADRLRERLEAPR